jgi:hypothetical protein
MCTVVGLKADVLPMLQHCLRMHFEANAEERIWHCVCLRLCMDGMHCAGVTISHPYQI